MASCSEETKGNEYEIECNICLEPYPLDELCQCKHPDCNTDERIYCQECGEHFHTKKSKKKEFHQLMAVSIEINVKDTAIKPSVSSINQNVFMLQKYKIEEMKANQDVGIQLNKLSFHTISETQSAMSSLTASSKIPCEGVCRDTYTLENVYICQHKDCANDRTIFCKSCGRCNHRWKSHAYNPNNDYMSSVQDLIQPEQSIFDSGKLNGALLVRGTDPVEKLLMQSRWFGAVSAHGTHMGGTFATSMTVNHAATVQAACGAGHSVVGSALAISAMGGLVGTAIGTAIEWAFIFNRYENKKIEKEEAMKLAATSLVANGVSAASFLGFMAVGAALGSPGGPIGWVVGSVVGAIICGILARAGINKMTQKHFKKEHETRSALQKEALEFFFHDENYDINDQNKFNEKSLRRTYRKLSLIYHPDRRDGDHGEWLRLSACYGTLIGMCEKQNVNANSELDDNDRPSVVGFGEYQEMVKLTMNQHVELNRLILSNEQRTTDRIITNTDITSTSSDTNTTTNSNMKYSHLGSQVQEDMLR